MASSSTLTNEQLKAAIGLGIDDVKQAAEYCSLTHQQKIVLLDSLKASIPSIARAYSNVLQSHSADFSSQINWVVDAPSGLVVNVGHFALDRQARSADETFVYSSAAYWVGRVQGETYPTVRSATTDGVSPAVAALSAILERR